MYWPLGPFDRSDFYSEGMWWLSYTVGEVWGIFQVWCGTDIGPLGVSCGIWHCNAGSRSFGRGLKGSVPAVTQQTTRGLQSPNKSLEAQKVNKYI